MADREMPQMSATTPYRTAGGYAVRPRYPGAAPPDRDAQWAAIQAQFGQQTNFLPEAAPKPKADPKPKETTKMADKTDAPTPARRLVQVFIADPDNNVPLDKSLLYSGDQQMTDLSDQELFFEIDIAGILKRHNELRATLTDKSVKSKTVHLEPARIRDLRMTVVTIAAF